MGYLFPGVKNKDMNSMLHFIRFCLHIHSPATQVTKQELRLLIKYAYHSNTIVELGCYEGNTTVALAKATQGIVYSVDPFTVGRLGISYGKIIATTHAKRSRVQNIQLIEKLSWEAAPTVQVPIDLLFIDAAHTYDAISRDWNDWTPKIRVGGHFALHDVRKAINSPYEVGSMQFFEQVVKDRDDYAEVEAVDSLAILKKLA